MSKRCGIFTYSICSKCQVAFPGTMRRSGLQGTERLYYLRRVGLFLDHMYVNKVGVYSALCVDSSRAFVCVSDTEKHERSLLGEHQG